MSIVRTVRMGGNVIYDGYYTILSYLPDSWPPDVAFNVQLKLKVKYVYIYVCSTVLFERAWFQWSPPLYSFCQDAFQKWANISSYSHFAMADHWLTRNFSDQITYILQCKLVDSIESPSPLGRYQSTRTNGFNSKFNAGCWNLNRIFGSQKGQRLMYNTVAGWMVNEQYVKDINLERNTNPLSRYFHIGLVLANGVMASQRWFIDFHCEQSFARVNTSYITMCGRVCLQQSTIHNSHDS